MLMKGEGEKERKNRLLLARVSSDTGDDARQKGDDRNGKEQEEKARHRGGERRKRDSEHKEEHRVKRGGRGEKIWGTQNGQMSEEMKAIIARSASSWVLGISEIVGDIACARVCVCLCVRSLHPRECSENHFHKQGRLQSSQVLTNYRLHWNWKPALWNSISQTLRLILQLNIFCRKKIRHDTGEEWGIGRTVLWLRNSAINEAVEGKCVSGV